MMRFASPTVMCLALSFGFVEAQAPSARAVLVTGASTGIGRKVTEKLASQGFFVYAGARKDADIKDLSAIPNVQGIRLDVTAPAEIAAAVETVRAGGRGLYGLVNNAGVAIIAPVTEVDEADLQFQLDVNVMGPYRVTKAFTELLIASKGRVVMTGSLSGFLSGFLSGPYSMSKHALEAYSDALAAEMARFGVKVSILEPGNYKSEIGTTLVARMKARGQTFEKSRFQKELTSFYERSGVGGGPEPDDVAEAALHALSDPAPQPRYLVVPNRGQAVLTIQDVLNTAAQLDLGHRYTLGRDSLVTMLDKALAASKAVKP